MNTIQTLQQLKQAWALVATGEESFPNLAMERAGVNLNAMHDYIKQHLGRYAEFKSWLRAETERSPEWCVVLKNNLHLPSMGNPTVLSIRLIWIDSLIAEFESDNVFKSIQLSN